MPYNRYSSIVNLEFSYSAPVALEAHDYHDLFDENPLVEERNHFSFLLFQRDIINREHVFALMTTGASRRDDVTHRTFPFRLASFLTIVCIFPRNASATTLNAMRRGIILHVSEWHLYIISSLLRYAIGNGVSHQWKFSTHTRGEFNLGVESTAKAVLKNRPRKRCFGTSSLLIEHATVAIFAIRGEARSTAKAVTPSWLKWR